MLASTSLRISNAVAAVLAENSGTATVRKFECKYVPKYSGSTMSEPKTTGDPSDAGMDEKISSPLPLAMASKQSFTCKPDALDTTHLSPETSMKEPGSATATNDKKEA